MLLLLRSDQRFFLTLTPVAGAGGELLESLPVLGAGAAAAAGATGRTKSLGAGRADSSKFVGREVTVAVGRRLVSVAEAQGGVVAEMVTMVLEWMGSSSVKRASLEERRVFLVGEAGIGVMVTCDAVFMVTGSSSLEDSTVTEDP